MLTSSKKTKFSYIRRVAVLPLLLLTTVVFAFTIKQAKVQVETTSALQVQKEESVNTIEESKQDTFIRKNGSKTAISTTDVKDTSKKIPKTKVAISFEDSITDKKNKTLVVLDGKQMSWQEFEKLGLKGELIQEISVLKDESSINKYGKKGKHGIIVITTKQNVLVDEVQTSYSRVFTVVQNPPFFPNGISAFADYINSNTQYPQRSIAKKSSGSSVNSISR